MRAGRRIMSKAVTTRKIREYCDGELTPQEAASVAEKLAQDAELGAFAEFERRLQEQVSAVLKTDSAPPSDLADRVRQALAAEAETPGWDAETPAIQTARRFPRLKWRAPVQANAFAVAATMVLVVGAVLFGIFGQSIDSWRGSRVDIALDVAGAVAGEHVAAVKSGPMRVPLYDTPDLAAEGLAQYLAEKYQGNRSAKPELESKSEGNLRLGGRRGGRGRQSSYRPGSPPGFQKGR